MGIDNLAPLTMNQAEARQETIQDMLEEYTNFETIQLERFLQQFERKRERDETNEV